MLLSHAPPITRNNCKRLNQNINITYGNIHSRIYMCFQASHKDMESLHGSNEGKNAHQTSSPTIRSTAVKAVKAAVVDVGVCSKKKLMSIIHTYNRGNRVSFTVAFVEL